MQSREREREREGEREGWGEATIVVYWWPWRERGSVKTVWLKRALLPSTAVGLRAAVLQEVRERERERGSLGEAERERERERERWREVDACSTDSNDLQP